MMRDYELTIILSSELKTEALKKLVAEIEKLIMSLKGKKGKKEAWGKKELGTYFHWPVKLLPKTIAQLDAKLKLEENVFRYLLVKINKQKKKAKSGAKVAK